ncbi:hypothetical protein IAS59_004015 [Cryptococcus gattii]
MEGLYNVRELYPISRRNPLRWIFVEGELLAVKLRLFRPLSFFGKCHHSHRVWRHVAFRDNISDPRLLRGEANHQVQERTPIPASRQQRAKSAKPLTLFNLCLADEHCAAHDICSVSDHDRRFAKP